MEPTIFQAHPEIIEEMFYHLDSSTLLNCRLVCKDWNQFLEKSTFWLDKLYEIDQPKRKKKAWKKLIAKSEDMDIEKGIFAKCLRMIFTDYIRAHEKSNQARRSASYKNLISPPLYTAAYFGILEIVKLIYELEVDCNRKMKIFPDIRHSYVMPIFAAAERGHIEIVKFFIENSQENQAQLLDADGNTLLMAAIKSKNLDLVNFLMPLMTNLNATNRYMKGAIHMQSMTTKF